MVFPAHSLACSNLSVAKQPLDLIEGHRLRWKTLIHNHSKILSEIDTDRQVFYAFTRGIFESNIIISSIKKTSILNIFNKETQIAAQDHLSAISINLPNGNSKIVGLYYQIFKRLAWENVPLYEVISTTNEFTVLVEDHLVDKAFSVIKGLKG